MNISKLAGGYIGAVGKFDKIAQQAHGLLCLATTLGSFLSPAGLLSALTSIATSAAGMILDAVGGMIQSRVNSLLKSVFGPLKMLQNYINRIASLRFGFSAMFGGIDSQAQNALSFIFNTQDCANQAAQMMNCISKVIAKKVTNKVLPKIDSVFGKLQSEVAQEVYKAGGLLEQQVGRRVRTAERLTAQLSILR
jgi:hypothetical protein